MLPTATTGAQVGPSTISLQSILLSSTGHGWPFSQARHRRISIRSTSLTTIFPPAAVQADVANAEDVERLFKESMDAFGRPDVVVHCAGIMPLFPIASGDMAAFDKVIATNLRGTFLVFAQAAQHVLDGGRIMAFSSSVLAK